MLPHTDRATLVLAPATLAIALALAVFPFDRVLASHASAPTPAEVAAARHQRTSGSWFEAGPVRVDALLSRSRVLRGSDGSLSLDLRLRAALATGREGARPPVDLA